MPTCTRGRAEAGGCRWASLPPAPTNRRYLPAEGTGPTCQASSCLVACARRWLLLGDVELPGVDSRWRVDFLDACIITYGKLFLPGGTYP
jgi:hypothetical protein